MGHPDIIAFVLAGGEGARLRPLTDHDAKPAVHLAREHRIVDFILGNLVNSRVNSIYLIAQYKPASLIEHVNAVWAAACVAARCELKVIQAAGVDRAARCRGAAWRHGFRRAHHANPSGQRRARVGV